MIAKGADYMAQISIRIDDTLKAQTENILNELGLSMSTTFTMLAKQIVRHRGLPFPVTLDDTDAEKESRKKAALSFVDFAKTHSVSMPGYKFDRDEIYDRFK
jgi:DNA-damage-inducible protein J